MKRIFFTCCILATTMTISLAQSTQTLSPAQTKASFETKVGQLNTYLTANDNTNGQATLTDLNHMMGEQMAATKMQIATAANETDKTAAYAKMRNEQTLYSHIMAASHSGLVANRADINTNLHSFLNTY